MSHAPWPITKSNISVNVLSRDNVSGYVSKNDIDLTFDPFKVVAKKDIEFQGKKILNAKDTFEINPENTFYEIELRKDGEVAAIFIRAFRSIHLWVASLHLRILKEM